MTHSIHTLHDFMLRTEGITYILIVVALVGFVFFWRFYPAAAGIYQQLTCPFTVAVVKTTKNIST